MVRHMLAGGALMLGTLAACSPGEGATARAQAPTAAATKADRKSVV